MGFRGKGGGRTHATTTRQPSLFRASVTYWATICRRRCFFILMFTVRSGRSQPHTQNVIRKVGDCRGRLQMSTVWSVRSPNTKVIRDLRSQQVRRPKDGGDRNSHRPCVGRVWSTPGRNTRIGRRTPLFDQDYVQFRELWDYPFAIYPRTRSLSTGPHPPTRGCVTTLDSSPPPYPLRADHVTIAHSTPTHDRMLQITLHTSDTH